MVCPYVKLKLNSQDDEQQVEGVGEDDGTYLVIRKDGKENGPFGRTVLLELKQSCCKVNTNLSRPAVNQELTIVILKCTQPLPKHRLRRFEVLASLPRSSEEIKTLIRNATE